MHPENQDDIVCHHNPMVQQSHSEDTVPLLRRVDNVEHRTESIEAKTERMEDKIRIQGQALEEMSKKMKEMANSGNVM